MKFQFGILHRTQRAANSEDLSTALGEYRTWDAETSGYAFDGPLLMGFKGDRITWEEETETQPFELGPYKLTFDGRLDNREDMAARVGLKANRNLPDPVVIAAAYAKHGDSIFPDLIGEFALVLWHTEKRELTFLRSVDGARPLFYILDSKRLIWSSALAHLMRASGAEPKVNERYVLQYLIFDPLPETAPFSTVGVVQPGMLLRFANDRFLPTTKLWEPREIQPLACASDAEYEELFRQKLKEAVRVRLRAKGTIFSELSGGLDSSSLVLLGDDILRDAGCDPRTLQTLSTVYDESYTCDERYFIKMIAARRGIDSTYVHEHEQKITLGLRNISFTGMPNNFDITPGRYPRFIEHMQKKNARVLLTGVGGDHIFCSAPLPEILVADSIQQRRAHEAHKRCKVWSRVGGLPYFGLLLKKALPLAVSPLLPSAWQYDVLKLPAWLNVRNQRDTRARFWIISPDRHCSPSLRLRLGMVESLFRTVAAGFWNAYPQLYVSHPYTHRPLVEFCLATPMSQVMRDGETRSLLRRALANLLPPKLLSRKGKGNIFEAVVRGVGREWTDVGEIGKWQVCGTGYIKQREFGESLEKLRMGLEHDMSIATLRVVTVERFMRSLSMIGRTQPQKLAPNSIKGEQPMLV